MKFVAKTLIDVAALSAVWIASPFTCWRRCHHKYQAATIINFAVGRSSLTVLIRLRISTVIEPERSCPTASEMISSKPNSVQTSFARLHVNKQYWMSSNPIEQKGHWGTTGICLLASTPKQGNEPFSAFQIKCLVFPGSFRFHASFHIIFICIFPCPSVLVRRRPYWCSNSL